MIRVIRKWQDGVLTRQTINDADGTSVGLGDKIAKFATPIARALKLPCIDPKTGKLRPESGCAKRMGKLNRMFDTRVRA